MRRAVAVAAALTAVALPTRAVRSDRLAVELLKDETAAEAALAYERACWRLGASVDSAAPVQEFVWKGARFVRLVVDGSAFAVRCLEALEEPRRGVDGTIEWFDAFQGGALVPSVDDERVPDSIWFDPQARPVPVALDTVVLERLSRGDVEALQELGRRPLPESLAYVAALVDAQSPGALAALESFAGQHPHWRVRRAAVESLDPTLGEARLVVAARGDTAWEVRHAAVAALGFAANKALATTTEKSMELAGIVRERALKDASWEVRRNALWHLSPPSVAAGGVEFARALLADTEPRVRATALETLTRAALLEEGSLLAALDDASPDVRAMAAHLLARVPTPTTLPHLWRALQDPERAVRLSAAPFLPFLETGGLDEPLWAVFLAEAERVDAEGDFLALVADALARSGAPAAPLAARLDTQLAPDERRVLSRAYARLDPASALARFGAQLTSSDPLLRSVAADVVPDTPDTRARRRSLLDDEHADVRAGAVLGLCRIEGETLSADEKERAALEPDGVGLTAAVALSRCGAPEPRIARLALALGTDEPAAPIDPQRGTVAAIVALALLLASVVGLKLSAKRG